MVSAPIPPFPPCYCLSPTPLSRPVLVILLALFLHIFAFFVCCSFLQCSIFCFNFTFMLRPFCTAPFQIDPFSFLNSPPSWRCFDSFRSFRINFLSFPFNQVEPYAECHIRYRGLFSFLTSCFLICAFIASFIASFRFPSFFPSNFFFLERSV